MRRFFTANAAIVLLLAALLAPPAARAGMLDVSDTREAKLGKEAADEVIKHYGLTENKSESERVEFIGRSIVAVCDRTDIDYFFYVLDTELVNAFAIPGGFVFMTTGILDLIDDDDELASVLGHEITHIAKKHGVTLYKKGLKDAMINFLLLVLTRDPHAVIAGQMVEQSRTEVFGRSAEIEADRLGLEYMYKAGYDPDAFARFIRKLQRYETHRPDLLEDYFDFHPPMDVRLELVDENYRRLGLKPPEGFRRGVSSRLVAGEVCEPGGKCYGVVKGPRGELMRLGDPGAEGTAYLRARSVAGAINRLLEGKLAFYEFKTKRAADGVELFVRGSRVVSVLPGDLEVNGSKSAAELMDRWVENIKLFMWNDIVKEEM